MSPFPALLCDDPVALNHELRSNHLQRDIVGRGITLQGDFGILAALEFLKSHAVAPSVIERVLLEPGRRAAS